MDELTIKAEQKRQVVVACHLAVNHAAVLCPSLREFVAEITTADAMTRTESLTLLRNRKRGLEGAELSLLRAAERLYGLDRLQGWVHQSDYIDILMLCEYGVAGEIDRENQMDPREASQFRMHAFLEESVLPLIQKSYQWMRAAQKEERKLEKDRIKSLTV